MIRWRYFFNSSQSSDDSSSSSESDDNLIDVISAIAVAEGLQDRPKNEGFVENIVPTYSDQQFVEHFRVSRRIVHQLSVDFQESEYYAKTDKGFKRITSEKCILAFLWFASNQTVSYRDVSDRFNLSLSTLYCVVQKVSRFLSDLAENVIVWPTREECQRLSEEFGRMGFPGAIACIDGTHIKLDTPSDDPDSYLNRKKYHSIQMQVVCDSNRKIRDVFIGFPGSVHDARVFRNSPLSHSIQEKCGDWFILGDSAYPCLRNLLTPYKETENLRNVHKNFNKKLSHCRVLIEHTIELLKQRFRQLYHVKFRKIESICHFIRACCVLDNICVDENVIEPAVDPEPTVEPNFEDAGAQDPVYIDIENERNEVGLNYRNYVAAMLNV
ncbi:hypothetical protein NQ315_016261 [Exocentrus adspersus]|uniref:Putative nuclease HARBI1 n=1 Tax=Exocentrus adspersus TaxID=1586481 RepID=A0AAV8VCB6_9CUCU|nr:hypothetical protein NQ315_016261 [Exocentrus adspersus]